MKSSSVALSLSVCLAAIVAGGCATHRPATFADQLIAGGKPSIEVGPAKPPADPQAFESYVAKVKALAASARPHAAIDPLPSVESGSPSLLPP